MAKRILAVHLAGSDVQVASAEASVRALRITRLSCMKHADPALAEFIADTRADVVVASLPSDAVLFRILEFPFHDRRRLGLAVGPSMEEHVPLALEDSQVAYDALAGTRPGSRILAAMAPATRVSEHLQHLEGIGVEPHQLIWTPSALMTVYQRALSDTRPDVVVVHGDRAGTVVANFEHGSVTGLRIHHDTSKEILARNVAWSVRTLEPASRTVVVVGEMAEALSPSLEIALDGFSVEPIAVPAPVRLEDSTNDDWSSVATPIGLILAATGESTVPILTFGREASGSQTSGRLSADSRPLLGWVAATLVFLLLTAGLDTARLARRTRALEARADRIIHEVLPTAAGGPGRRIKMELRLTELLQRQATVGGTSRHSALETLVTLSEAVPRQVAVEFDTYVYDPPTIHMRGHANDFEDVTRLERALEGNSAIESAEASGVRASVGGSGVDFDLTVRLAGSEGSSP